MPKAFNEQEKATIRAQLREQGELLFARHGLKKTSVDDLTQAVSISKGAFYHFYTSKEELLMEILEAIEETMQRRILDAVVQQDQHDARQTVRTVLTQFLLLWDEYPLLKEFSQEEYMILVRKLPPVRVQQHQAQDERFLNSLVEKFAREGISLHQPPHIMANLVKSLFFVGLHREELGSAAYPETMAILVDLVADYLTAKG